MNYDQTADRLVALLKQKGLGWLDRPDVRQAFRDILVEESAPLGVSVFEDDGPERLGLLRRMLDQTGVGVEVFSDENDSNFVHVYLRHSDVSKYPLFVGALDARVPVGRAIQAWAAQKWPDRPIPKLWF